MTGKKDDACDTCSGSAITDELAPMRRWESGMAGTGYTTGPSHLDRVDFGDTTADAPTTEGETTSATEAEATSSDDDPPA